LNIKIQDNREKLVYDKKCFLAEEMNRKRLKKRLRLVIRRNSLGKVKEFLAFSDASLSSRKIINLKSSL